MNVQSIRRFLVLPGALAVLACLGAGPALAETPLVTNSVSVKYADLDIGTPSGAAALYHRIEGAARVVCGYVGLDLSALQQVRSCNAHAIDEAVTTLNSPLVTAIHARKGASLTAMRE